jgi:signal transduction histidine kinase
VSIRNPDFLCVAVSDNGQGIDETSKGKIFERLYQIPGATSTSRKGLGLGLHICKELVTLHGGQIWVDSQLGEGTTFYFTLPILGRRSAVARLPAIKLPAAAQSDSVTNESVNILESQKA